MRHLNLRSLHVKEEYTRPIHELLKIQNKGGILTLKEREVLKDYASERRVKNLHNKKKKRRR